MENKKLLEKINRLESLVVSCVSSSVKLNEELRRIVASSGSVLNTIPDCRDLERYTGWYIEDVQDFRTEVNNAINNIRNEVQGCLI